jgi:hypothetical protein
MRNWLMATKWLAAEFSKSISFDHRRLLAGHGVFIQLPFVQAAKKFLIRFQQFMRAEICYVLVQLLQLLVCHPAS